MRAGLKGALCALLASTALPAWAADVASPNGRTVVTLDVDGDGVPFYRVVRDGKPLIADSDLGFLFTDAQPMRRNFKVESETRAAHDDTWEQPWGERRFVRDHHNELAVTFREGRQNSNRALTVRMRVFDDGIGFRYEFPDSDVMPVANIAEELTELIQKQRAFSSNAKIITTADEMLDETVRLKR